MFKFNKYLNHSLFVSLLNLCLEVYLYNVHDTSSNVKMADFDPELFNFLVNLPML